MAITRYFTEASGNRIILGCTFWAVTCYGFFEIAHPTDVYPLLATLRLQRLYFFGLIISAAIYGNIIKNIGRNTVLVWLFLGWCLICSMISNHSSESIVVVYDYFKIVLYLTIVVGTMRDMREVAVFTGVMVLFEYANILLSMREFLFFGQNVYDMGVKRMIGWAASVGPNRLAIDIVFFLPFAALISKHNIFPYFQNISQRIKKRTLKMFTLSYFIFAIIAVVLTQSRTGLIMLLIYMALALATGRRKILVLILIMTTLFVGYSMLPESTLIRYRVIIGSSDETVTSSNIYKWGSSSRYGRIEGINEGMRVFSENPFFGVGPGVFQIVSPTREQTHNLFLQIASETGTIGIVLFGLFIISLYMTMRRLRRNGSCKIGSAEESFQSELVIACRNAMVLLVVGSLSSHTAFFFNWILLAGILESGDVVSRRPLGET